MTNEEKVLEVVKDDIDNLMHRLNNHFDDYMRVFTQKRTRDHFKDVFFSRFREVSISDLIKLEGDILREVNTFYFHVNEVYWYIKVTEDMPSMVENKMKSDLVKLNNIAAKINEMLLSGASDTELEEPNDQNDELDLPPPFEDDMTKQ